MVDDDKRGKIEAHNLALKNIPLFWKKHWTFLKKHWTFSKIPRDVFLKQRYVFPCMFKQGLYCLFHVLVDENRKRKFSFMRAKSMYIYMGKLNLDTFTRIERSMFSMKDITQLIWYAHGIAYPHIHIIMYFSNLSILFH